MSRKNQNARIQFKYSTIGGTQPSIAPSMDHTDGTWSPTDLYVGEFFLNAVDDTMWVRTLNGIVPLTSGTTSIDISTYVNKTGDTMTGELVLPTMSATTGIYSPYIYSDVFSGGTYYGDGSNLTGIPYTTFTGGTVNGDTTFTAGVDFTSASVSANTIDTAGGLNFIGGDVSVGNNLDVTGAVTATTFYGDGSNLTGLNISGFTGYWDLEPVNQNSIKTTFGSNTFVGSPEYSIVGGNFNTIYYSSNNSTIFGLKNEVVGAPTSHVLASSSVIQSGSTYSSIFGGDGHSLRGTLSSIFGGNKNKIAYNDVSTIVGGYYNTISASTTYNFNSILGGQYNSIEGGYSNTIIGSSYSTIDDSGGNSISCAIISHNYTGKGTQPYNKGSVGSVMLGGENNYINSTNNHQIIIGGFDNTNEGPTSMILGGRGNLNKGLYSTIVGGEYNVVDNGVVNSVILGGSNLTATTDSTAYVEKLNIDNVPTGSSINNLGIDVNGNVVIGSGGASNPTLSQVLTAGNTTGGNNIQTNYGDYIGSNPLSFSRSNIQFNTNNLFFEAYNSGLGDPDYGGKSIELHTTGITVSNTLGTFSGVEYGADYSSNYTNRSLVDKEYVDGIISGSGNTLSQVLTNGNTTGGNDIVVTTTDSVHSSYNDTNGLFFPSSGETRLQSTDTPGGGFPTNEAFINLNGNSGHVEFEATNLFDVNIDRARFSGQIEVGSTTGNTFSTNTFNFNCDNGMVQEVDGQGMSANGTITFSNQQESATYTIIFIQGSGLYDVDLGSGYWLNSAAFDFTTLADNERAMITATRLNGNWYFAVKNLTFVV